MIVKLRPSYGNPFPLAEALIAYNRHASGGIHSATVRTHLADFGCAAEDGSG